MLIIQVLLKIFIKLFEQRFTKYKDFMSEDFLSDTCFIEWVQSENHEVGKEFWQAFLERYPQKQQEIELAKSILNRTHDESLSKDEVASIWNRINLTISIIN
ncbi:hypothetical protein J2Y47_004144 [Arcicella sp. BE51]|nr:hypothetical protein [Arcicella sp. BE51]